ncbi:MAG: endonuclease [Gemmatimonadetes bacterium]|nr:endonuclease [Gemmatimonadota bacterium]
MLRVLNWNVGNPSAERALMQCDWLSRQAADAIVFTEVKDSAATRLFQTVLANLDYRVQYAPDPDGGYSTLLAARDVTSEVDLPLSVSPSRVSACSLNAAGTPLLVIGVYVPSRGPKAKRNVAKRAFQDAFSQLMRDVTASSSTGVILAGDLNVVEPHHVPRHRHFGGWEFAFYRDLLDSGLVDAYRHRCPDGSDHSWFGRSGRGYRFDHVFVTEDLAPTIQDCWYDHTVRETRLSDHSAMWVSLSLEGRSR